MSMVVFLRFQLVQSFLNSYAYFRKCIQSLNTNSFQISKSLLIWWVESNLKLYLRGELNVQYQFILHCNIINYFRDPHYLSKNMLISDSQLYSLTKNLIKKVGSLGNWTRPTCTQSKRTTDILESLFLLSIIVHEFIQLIIYYEA